MTIMAEIIIGQFDYTVEHFLMNDEFAVYQVSGCRSKQLGDPIPVDRPLSEYTAFDYDEMVRKALASSENY